MATHEDTVHATTGFASKSAMTITSLTDNSGGTASDTIADMPMLYSETTTANAFASIAAKINDILAKLRTSGIIDP